MTALQPFYLLYHNIGQSDCDYDIGSSPPGQFPVQERGISMGVRIVKIMDLYVNHLTCSVGIYKLHK
jgi:hypothetical protein